MNSTVLYAVIIALLAVIVLLVISKNKRSEIDLGALLETMSKGQKSELKEFREMLDGKLNELRENNEGKLEKINATLDSKIASLTESNQSKLDKMNETVGDKLQTNIKESFKAVTERLDSVNKTVGEISGLTGDVKDLRKLFTGVKTRGVWGEAQLRTIIEQMLTKEQYIENTATKPKSSEHVEFAIVMPGQDDSPVLLPVDAKCPVEDYRRIVEASHNNDTAEEETARKALRTRILAEAKDIRDKYIEVPYTTDFGILFAPIEGLFVEILAIDGLYDELMEKYRVIPAGPTTFAALLNSLKMGFRTLQIQKRTKEIEIMLGKAKTEFEKYGEVIEKVEGYINLAGKTLDTVVTRNKKITAALKNVESVPTTEDDFDTEE